MRKDDEIARVWLVSEGVRVESSVSGRPTAADVVLILLYRCGRVRPSGPASHEATVEL